MFSRKKEKYGARRCGDHKLHQFPPANCVCGVCLYLGGGEGREYEQNFKGCCYKTSENTEKKTHKDQLKSQKTTITVLVLFLQSSFLSVYIYIP